MKEVINSEINSINDLTTFRSAPNLSIEQTTFLLKELSNNMKNADWFTIGIMSPTKGKALLALRDVESFFHWTEMQVKNKPNKEGPVFLKANQKSGEINIRIEYGLGEGILISCQHDQEMKNADTYGPFPLDMFRSK